MKLLRLALAYEFGKDQERAELRCLQESEGYVHLLDSPATSSGAADFYNERLREYRVVSSEGHLQSLRLEMLQRQAYKLGYARSFLSHARKRLRLEFP